MPLLLTPPYLALLGATLLFVGFGEDASLWMVVGAGLLLVGLVSALVLLLHRRWLRRLCLDAHAIRAEVTGVVAAPIEVGGRRPHRVACRGLTPPAVGRTFRSGWSRACSAVSPSSLVTVLLDPRRPSRYHVDVGAAPPAQTRPLRRVLRHVGALAAVLGAAFVEVIAIGVARPEAPPVLFTATWSRAALGFMGRAALTGVRTSAAGRRTPA